MNYLSLFTGAMGGDLACVHLMNWNCMGAVEIDEYCQKLIRQRQEDGLMPRFPIFDDIRTFISEGYAESYQGMVDVITAGFPCQPFSIAGKQRGEDDERNMWPAIIEVIRRVRPRYCLLENVPGLLVHKYFGRILRDLAESGYDARWKVISAAELGAPHKRDRLWIIANSRSIGSETGMAGSEQWQEGNTRKPINESHQGRIVWWHTDPADVSDSEQFNGDCGRHGASPLCGERPEQADLRGSQQEMGDAEHMRELQPEGKQQDERGWAGNPSEEYYEFPRVNKRKPKDCDRPTEPRLGRVAHGVAHRVDRLKAIGNGQVPAVVRAAWEILK